MASNWILAGRCRQVLFHVKFSHLLGLLVIYWSSNTNAYQSRVFPKTRSYFQLGTLKNDFMQFFQKILKKVEVLKLVCNF